MVARSHATLPVALVPLLAAHLAAQSADVGAVGEIRVVGKLQGCEGAVSTPGSTAVHIRRNSNEFMVRAGDQERVLVGDEYRVHHETDVELRIHRLGSGKLTLAPQILCSLRSADTTLRSFVTPDTGVYSVSTRLDSARTYLTFNVERGGAFVEWNRGSPALFVVAGGHVGRVVRVDSTEIIIAVSDPGRLAFLYVREGTVSFPSAVELAARRNELWELRPDEVPRRLTMPPGDLSRIVERDLSHHLGSAGIPPPRDPGARRSFWRRPSTYVIAGGLAAATYVGYTLCCVPPPSPTPRRHHTGTAVVHIPL